MYFESPPSWHVHFKHLQKGLTKNTKERKKINGSMIKVEISCFVQDVT